MHRNNLPASQEGWEAARRDKGGRRGGLRRTSPWRVQEKKRKVSTGVKRNSWRKRIDFINKGDLTQLGSSLQRRSGLFYAGKDEDEATREGTSVKYPLK